MTGWALCVRHYLKCAKVHTIYQPVFSLSPIICPFYSALSVSSFFFHYFFPFSLPPLRLLAFFPHHPPCFFSQESLQHSWWQNLTSLQWPQIDVQNSWEKCFIPWKSLKNNVGLMNQGQIYFYVPFQFADKQNFLWQRHTYWGDCG